VAARRLQPTLNALSKAAAYLPTGRALKEAHAKRRAVSAEMRNASNAYVAFRSMLPLINRFRRLQLQIYNDYKALGVTRCGPPPPLPIPG